MSIEANENEKRLRERHRQWEETRINQFSYVNYLILTFALATLGFAADLGEDTGMHAVGVWGWHAVSFLLASVLFGIACAISRLYDYRMTAKRALVDYGKGREYSTDASLCLHYAAKQLGKISWWFLKWQVGAFVVGLIFLAGDFVKNTL